jgi:DnaJ-class molecular chaperone
MNEQEAKARQKAYNEYLSNFDGENAGKFMDAAFQFAWQSAMDYSRSDGERYRTALERWMCGRCEGLKFVPFEGGPRKARVVFDTPCSDCNGTGLNPIASEALEGK